MILTKLYIILVQITLKYIIMAYVINNECTSCGSCVDECPVDSISQGAEIYVIDAATCTDCGACAEVCPVEAIHEG